MPKILIVDDEPHIQQLLEQTLEDLEEDGVELLCVGNGTDALEIIKSERPELVFLDVMMPGMSGFEVCEIVKKDLGLPDIYIVILTAKGQEYDKERGGQSGVDVYMTKPFDPDLILKKAMDVLGINIGN
jgi:CheY-like chemotaxis protein